MFLPQLGLAAEKPVLPWSVGASLIGSRTGGAMGAVIQIKGRDAIPVLSLIHI